MRHWVRRRGFTPERIAACALVAACVVIAAALYYVALAMPACGSCAP